MMERLTSKIPISPHKISPGCYVDIFTYFNYVRFTDDIQNRVTVPGQRQEPTTIDSNVLVVCASRGPPLAGTTVS